MSIADGIENNGKPTKGKPKAQQHYEVQGNELAIALQETAALQVQQMQALIGAYEVGMDAAADKLAGYLTGEMQGGLASRVMDRVAQRYSESPTQVTFDIPSVQVPERNTAQTRNAFMGLFGGDTRPNPFLTGADSND